MRISILTPVTRVLKLVFDPEVRAAKRQARQHVQEHHPDSIVGFSLRAIEPTRFVFAVFCNAGFPRRPAPYVFVFVDRQTFATAEVSPSPDWEYWIRGRK